MAQALAEFGFLAGAAPALEQLNSSKKNMMNKYKYIVFFISRNSFRSAQDLVDAYLIC